LEDSLIEMDSLIVRTFLYAFAAPTPLCTLLGTRCLELACPLSPLAIIMVISSSCASGSDTELQVQFLACSFFISKSGGE
jgi:hypothetical protein